MKLVHKFTPRGAARELFNSRVDEIILDGPAGTGKSRACLEKLHMMMLINPGAKALIVRKTAVSLTSTALATFEKKVIPEALKSGDVRWFGGSAREPAQYKYSNGSAVVVGGMDLSTKIMSSEYDVIYVQEATELLENDWEALTSRLRNGFISFQQIIADCNPDIPTHWLKQRESSGALVMLQSRHEDNPMLYRPNGTITDVGRSYMRKLDSLTGVRLHRLRWGRWVAAEGIIYTEYDPAVHLIDTMPEGWETWTRWWTIDWGVRHPFVCQRWAEDYDGRLYLYAERYMTGKTVDIHAKAVMDVVAPRGRWTEPKPQAIITDHDPGSRMLWTRETKMPTKLANKDVNTGIQVTQRRFRIAEDGKPRIFFVRGACTERDPELVDAKRATCTIDEIPGYIWKDKGKEEPVKVEDDGMDGMRYLVAHKDLVGGYRMRVVNQ